MNRAIIHLDLDCFYCQVEQVRQNIRNEPLCVQQWNGILSVNYDARKLGITRQWTAKDIKDKLPNVHLAHVPVLQMGGTKPGYYTESNIHTQKTSLYVYRQASIEIMKLIQSVCPNYQKASIDEAYMDVTDQVNQMIVDNGWSDKTPLVWNSDTFHAIEKVEQSFGIDDARLILACELSEKVRKLIFDTLGYTASTGVASNKALAKLISSMNKPNKQTVLRNNNILEFMKTIPFSKIQGLGGKLGKKVEGSFSVAFASDLWKFSLGELQTRFNPEVGKWLYDISRGVCLSQVSKTQQAKSIQSIKSFNKKLTVIDQLKKWLVTMSAEIFDRANEDFSETGRWPKNLTVSFSVGERIVKHFKFPHQNSLENHVVLFETIWKSIELAPKKLPVGYISMSLTGLEKVSSQSIMNWARPTIPRDISIQNSELSTFSKSSSILLDKRSQTDALLHTLDENGDVLFFKCLECGEAIPIQKKQEHQDHHFALMLARSFDPDPVVVHVPTKRKVPKSKSDFFRKRNGNSSKNNNNNTI
jgi:DNA polymerase eta